MKDKKIKTWFHNPSKDGGVVFFGLYVGGVLIATFRSLFDCGSFVAHARLADFEVHPVGEFENEHR